jgi:putative transposase
MSWVATSKGFDAGLVGDLMMPAVEKRFESNSKQPKSIEWLTDNGRYYTATEKRNFSKQLCLKPVKTPVINPQINGISESFVKSQKREFVRLAYRPNSKTVMSQLKDWFIDYTSHNLNAYLVTYHRRCSGRKDR